MSVAIEIHQLRKTFGTLEALKGIDLSVQQGEFFALLGPNGAGKSTLINTLAGLLRPTSGSISVMGYDVQQHYREARQSLGVVPQELVFDPFFNVREMLRFQAGYFGRGRANDAWVDEVIECLGLADKANTNMRRLSGGMKRRALIAQALAHRPPVIVLDEPTAGVDVELRQMMWAFIQRLNQEGHTILLTTHYLEEAETLCSRVAVMKLGEVVALDTTRNLLKRIPGKSLRLSLQTPHLPSSLAGLVRQQTGQTVTLSLTDVGEIEGILSAIRLSGNVIEDMQLLEADLEDVFVELVRK